MSKVITAGNRAYVFKGHDSLFIAYELSLLMLMFASMKLSMTWNLQTLYISMPAGAITFVYWLYNRNSFIFDNKKNLICLLFTIIYLYRVLFVDVRPTLEGLINITVAWFCGLSVILSSLEIKKILLELFTKSLGVILAFSLPWWILYLCGVPLPHGPMFFDGTFYVHTNYYLFQVNSEYQDVLHRFASIFKEPGHIATTSVFLMCANKFNFRRWEVWLMLFATLLSLSLAGYCLLIGGYGLFLMLNSRHRVIYLTLFVLLLTGLSIYVYQTKKQNSVLYEFIFSRLEYSGGKMKGNNRVSDDFKLQYRYFTEKEEAWLGVGKHLIENGRLTDWTVGSAGWKRHVVWYGYIGSLLTLLFIAMYVKCSKEVICFLVVFLVANSIRDYPFREYWLYIFITAMSVLPAKATISEERRQIVTSNRNVDEKPNGELYADE